MPTIDADAHVVESERTWDYMDAADQKYRPIVVKPSGDQGGEYWFIDGKIRGLVRIVMTAHELDKVADRTGRVMFTPQETREMENVDARVKHMDELGIDIQVLYPTIFIEQITEKPEWEIPICKGYNRWLADIHQQGKGRLRWICVLPLLDMSASLEELQFCKQNGACGVFMRGIEGRRLLTDPYFYPLYEKMSELDMAVGVHVGNGNPQEEDLVSQYNGGGSFWKFRIPIIGAFHSVIMGGLPQMFPKLRFHWAEAAALWVPYVVKDLKRRWGAQGQGLSGQSAQGVPAVRVMPDGRRRGLHLQVFRRGQPRHRHRLRPQRPVHRDRGAPESEGARQHHRAPVREDHRPEPEGAVRVGVVDPPRPLTLRPPLPQGEGRGEGATGTVGVGFKPARARPAAC